MVEFVRQSVLPSVHPESVAEYVPSRSTLNRQQLKVDVALMLRARRRFLPQTARFGWADIASGRSGLVVVPVELVAG